MYEMMLSVIDFSYLYKWKKCITFSDVVATDRNDFTISKKIYYTNDFLYNVMFFLFFSLNFVVVALTLTQTVH